MTRATHALFLTLVVVLFSSVSLAQVAKQPMTGTPPFGSFGGGPDVINLGNLNAHLTIPIRHKPGRGLNFTRDLTYDSSVWYPVTSGGTTSWQPVTTTTVPGWQGLSPAGSSFVGYGYSHNQQQCTNNGTTFYTFDIWGYGPFYYYDELGIRHDFQNIGWGYISNPSQGICGPQSGYNPSSSTQSSLATDGSGYTLTVVPSFNSNVSATVVDSNGTTKGAPVVSNPTVTSPPTTDSNGNQITSTNGSYTDTLNTLALAVAGAAPSNTTLSYTAPSDALVSFVVKYTTATVKTLFNCSGIGEYGPLSQNLVSEVDLPDNSKYTFTYETTPNDTHTPHYVTGRVASITLPTGGTISYQYSGGGTGVNGITCADGTAATLSRQLGPGVTWIYTRSGSGNSWTTTITDPTTPTGNQTAIDFQKDSAPTNPTPNFYETRRLTYQGATTGTLLQTAITCYNGVSVGTPASCPTTAVASPILRRTLFNYLPDSLGKQAETDVLYNSSGLTTETDEYDFGSGAVGALTRKTLTPFTTMGRPSLVKVTDGSNNVVAQTTYTYDEGTVTTTTGTPQHIAVTGSRGNLTTIATKVNATQTLYRKFTYYDTGTPNTLTDVSLSSTTNGPTTTYVYGTGSCGNSFVTQVNLPLSLARSMTWNCMGGVQLSRTDANSNTVSATYSDPYFWRPAKGTDELQNDMTITYNVGTTAAEVALAFNTGTSVANSRAKFDGLGRPILSQRRQGPSATNYDSAETDYDVSGRVAKATQAYAASVDSLCTGTCPGITFAYDALSRPITITDAGGGTITASYTKNDVLKTVGPAPTGENAKSKQLEFDALGRRTSVCEVTSLSGSANCGQSSPQAGYLTKYVYDLLDNLTGVTQNAQAPVASQQTRTYTFDQLGRTTSEINPENGTTTYAYDTDATCGTSAGDLVKRIDAASNVTCYGYDQLHRVLSVTYPSGPYATTTPQKYFVYDAATINGISISNAKGRLAEAYTCNSCTPTLTKITDLWYSYSKRGETIDSYETTPHSGSTPYHVSLSYWAHGVPNALSGIPGVPTIYYGASDGSGLDGEGRLTRVTVSGTGQTLVTGSGSSAGVTYTNSGTAQPIGSLTQVTFGSSDNDNFSYDTNTGLPKQYQFNMGSAPQTDTGALTWNANGTLKSLGITDQINSAENQTCNYGYDDLSRQAAAACQTIVNNNPVTVWNQSFGFDPFGNISKAATVGTSFQATYAPSTNRLTQIGSLVPTYDADGNLTNDTAHTYTWDAEGTMLTADGTAFTLTYDALGRMIEQGRSGTYTEILYGPGGGKLALMSGQTLQKAFVPLPGGATAVYNSSGLAYYRHSDWLSSSRLATTPARTKYYDVGYAPYGENYIGSGTTPDLSFTGQNQDTASWLDDFLFREYNPVQGRWMSPDPAGVAAVNIGDPQTWNRYAYVMNNPLALIDPYGLYQSTCELYGTHCPPGGGGGGSGGGPVAKRPEQPAPREGAGGGGTANYGKNRNCKSAAAEARDIAMNSFNPSLSDIFKTPNFIEAGIAGGLGSLRPLVKGLGSGAVAAGFVEAAAIGLGAAAIYNYIEWGNKYGVPFDNKQEAIYAAAVQRCDAQFPVQFPTQ